MWTHPANIDWNIWHKEGVIGMETNGGVPLWYLYNPITSTLYSPGDVDAVGEMSSATVTTGHADVSGDLTVSGTLYAGAISGASSNAVAFAVRTYGPALPAGTFVRVIGSIGDLPVVSKSHADRPATCPAVGFIGEAIPNNGTGSAYATTAQSGFIGLPTGEVLYLGTDALVSWVGSGNYPPAGALLQRVGTVLRGDSAFISIENDTFRGGE